MEEHSQSVLGLMAQFSRGLDQGGSFLAINGIKYFRASGEFDRVDWKGVVFF